MLRHRRPGGSCSRGVHGRDAAWPVRRGDPPGRTSGPAGRPRRPRNRPRWRSQKVNFEKLGNIYIQNIISNNNTIIRAFSNQYYWLSNKLYDIDFKEFSIDETGKLTAELSEIFSDPILKSNDVTKRDIKNLANTSPMV